MDKKLGICLIGVGFVGEVHAEEYQNFKDKINLFLCDQNKSRVQEFAEKFHAKGWFTDYKEALEQDDIAAVDICLPHNLHAEVAVNAAKSGKHISLEKPMATTLKEADLIIEEAKKAGVTLMVAENYHFEPSVLKAKELIETGVIGKIFLIEAVSMNYWAPPTWRRNKAATGGGALIDRGVHMIDYLFNLGGEVDYVQAALIHHEVVREMEGEDTVIALLKYKSGASGSLVVSWGILNPPPMPWLSVCGDHGAIYEVPGRRLGFRRPPRLELTAELNVYSNKVEEYNIRGGKIIELQPNNPFKEELSDFINCISTGKTPKMTGEIARKDLEIIHAIYRSAETSRPVKLKQKSEGFK